MSDAQQVAIVTGGSRGIGRAISERLAREGYAILLTYRERNEAAEEVARAIEAANGRAVAVRADLARENDVAQIFAACDDAFGRLDVLILNAAVIPHAPTTELTTDEFDRAFAVNTRAGFLALRHAAERMRPGGRIVHISTGLTRSPGPQTAAYAASKAAMETIVRVFAMEMGVRGIRINTLQPGVTDTESMHLPEPVVQGIIAQTPFGRIGRPEEIADVAAFLVSNDARWITGEVLRASGGLR